MIFFGRMGKSSESDGVELEKGYIRRCCGRDVRDGAMEIQVHAEMS